MHPDEQNINTTPIDGIEILLNLARTGKIEPWDIDIGQVTDQYLQILAELKSYDLKLTGKTLLYAAILLRMKSDSLAGIDFLSMEPTDEFLEDDFLADQDKSPLKFLSKAFQSLDQMIQRRTSAKQPRNRRVTLNDLIKELKKYEEIERKRKLKETVEKHEKRRMRNYANLSSDDIVELAHEEFIEDTVFRMKYILEQFFIKNEAMSLSQLETEGKIDRVSAFIAVLFLSAREECDLEQSEFYGELFITPMGPALVEELHPPLEMAG